VDTINYHTGEIKLEANLEYRFDLFWKLEGAFFVDAGNIWNMNSGEQSTDETEFQKNLESGDFSFNRFYEEIAVGAGIGARLDFSFFILRLDAGVKLRDPALPEKNRFVPSYGLNSKDFTWHIGIGYPF
jgi:outer membrane protein assembly factor BamA